MNKNFIINEKWHKEPFAQLVKDVTKNFKKIKQQEYQESGKYPVVDQSKNFISGFTNEEINPVEDPKYIIFGDHTRVFKYVDFLFAIGADGVKVLKVSEKLIPKFFFYYCLTLDIPNTGYNRHYKYLKEKEIIFPNLNTQQKVIDLLDEVDSLIQKAEESIVKLNELAKSVFYEMFGEIKENPNHWEVKQLEEVAQIRSGVTKGKKLKGPLITVPYMRVANVQDGFLNLNEIKNIDVSMEDYQKYLLQSGDVLLTEGGDPDKLGRGAVWRNEVEGCIHQNHIFRVRVNQKVILPEYLNFCTGSEYGKAYFLKAAKQTTGIASINSTQLKSFPVIIPPISIQKNFREILNEIRIEEEVLKNRYLFLKNLFNSLLQQSFKGELF